MLVASLLTIFLVVVLELSSFRVLESVSDEGIGWGGHLEVGIINGGELARSIQEEFCSAVRSSPGKVRTYQT